MNIIEKKTHAIKKTFAGINIYIFGHRLKNKINKQHEIIKDKTAKITFFKDNTSILINYIINIKKFLDDTHFFI